MTSVSADALTRFTTFYPNFNPEKIESLSLRSWKELFADSVARKLPSYVVAVTIWQGNANAQVIKCKLFDAALFNYCKDDIIQAYKSLTLSKIIYFSIDCFDNTEKSPPPALTAANFNCFMPVSYVPELSSTLEQAGIEGCNYTLKDEEYLGNIQYLVSCALFDLAKAAVMPQIKQGFICKANKWLYCAVSRLGNNEKIKELKELIEQRVKLASSRVVRSLDMESAMKPGWKVVKKEEALEGKNKKTTEPIKKAEPSKNTEQSKKAQPAIKGGVPLPFHEYPASLT